MSLLNSASRGSSFDELHLEIQRWIREQNWPGLREIQDRAIRQILSDDADVIIMAGTASGKTEAAFLPLLTKAAEADHAGLRLLYVSPLKALINDQFRRLEGLCDRLELPLTRWHGDAPQGPKAKLLQQPRGAALITPESIEALLLRKPHEASRLFAGVQAVIIDELHAFVASPRGLHLASLLHRMEALTGNRPQRVGLSATLGNADYAASWLNKKQPSSVVLLKATGSGPAVKLQIRGYEEPPEASAVDELAEDGSQDALSRIADHLFSTLRGTNNLVFAGSRRTVEAVADRLRQRCERKRVPEEFFPHHGSLSKELREALETRLKVGNQPTTAVATTTLELGIDLGSVESVAQIGAPRSMSGLKQRLGRSGRRGSPAVLRIYIREKHLVPDLDPLDCLRLGTVRAIACVRLLQENWVEPSRQDSALGTVALHQTLSVISSQGGMKPLALHRRLFSAESVLELKTGDFADLLRGAAKPGIDLLEQSAEGLIMLGAEGERLVEARDFYAVFSSDEEWRLVSGGKTLGTVPISNMLGVGSMLGFAGRRWRVEAVDDRARVLDVVPHRSGKLPRFDRLASESIHDRVSATMRQVLHDDEMPAYLNGDAKRFLAEGRRAYARLRLEETDYVPSGRDTYLFTWRGTTTNDLLAILLIRAGLEAEAFEAGVTVVDCSPAQLKRTLAQIEACPPTSDLSEFVQNLRSAKYDEFIDEALLRRLWEARNADGPAAVTEVLAGVR